MYLVTEGGQMMRANIEKIVIRALIIFIINQLPVAAAGETPVPDSVRKPGNVKSTGVRSHVDLGGRVGESFVFLKTSRKPVSQLRMTDIANPVAGNWTFAESGGGAGSSGKSDVSSADGLSIKEHVFAVVGLALFAGAVAVYMVNAKRVSHSHGRSQRNGGFEIDLTF